MFARRWRRFYPATRTLRIDPSSGGHAMPYANTRDRPDPVRNALPAHAQDIYKEAFNHAWDEYSDADERRGDESREEVAHKVAWSAVKTKYEKGDDGHWHARRH
jgi:cation transport regulator